MKKKTENPLPKMLPGSVHAQYVRCGKATCKCARGELHGAYYYHFARKQSIINRKSRRQRTKARSIKILCVEDYQVVADAVKETLEELGWKVELCADGTEAMRKIESKTRYHLLILDNQLPGKDGLELARRSRQLPHRRRTPIIMLSASDVEQDALRVGVNAFLRKPQDIGRLSATVTRLLTKNTTAR